MSKFDDVIKQKRDQLNEIAGGTANVQQTAQPPQQVQQPQPNQPQPNQSQPNQTQGQTPNPQNQQQGQAPQSSDPAQTLAQAFQGMKFSDPTQAVQVLNNAMKTAGNAPGIKEFFGSLGFDPKQGFMVTQQKTAPQQQQAPQQSGPAPLK